MFSSVSAGCSSTIRPPTPWRSRTSSWIIPDDVKDDSYYRARKAVLMEELSERFGDLLTVVRQQRGEERFLSMDDSRLYLPFVAECLDRFAPWDTPCWAEARAQLRAPVSDRELRRIHAILHPSCLERLVAGLRLNGLASRLALPRFAFPVQETRTT